MCPKTYTQYYYYKKHVTENHLWGCHILVPTTSQNMLAIIISGKLRSHSVVGRINYFKQIFLFVCCFFSEYVLDEYAYVLIGQFHSHFVFHLL